MNDLTDTQLLHEYSQHRSEAAFGQLVRRHVDLVYSAALRMVRDAHLAEDVSQCVFVALAQNAAQLRDRPVLSGWLHRTAQNLAAKAVRSAVRRRNHEQEAAAMNELLSAQPDLGWDQIAPQLDAALGDLSEPDRDALMLRYFERKSAREMAQTLGVSDAAAQKRVNRAVERLREFLAKRGVTVGASGLVVVLSAHGVQAAPVGLAATLATSALATATITTATAAATTAATTSLISMTTLKIGLIGATVAAATMAAPLVIQHQTQAKLIAENGTLRQQLAELKDSPPASASQASVPEASPQTLSQDQFSELLRLRAEVARLRLDSATLKSGSAQAATDPISAEAAAWLARVDELKAKLEQKPDLKIPELQYLTPRDWLNVALDAKLDTDTGARQAFSRLRATAKQNFAPTLRKALNGYVQASGGQMPTDLSQLQPYFSKPVDPALLDRYQLARVDDGALDKSQDTAAITEKAQVDPDFDTLLNVGLNGATLNGQSGGGSFGFGGGFSTASRFTSGTNSVGTGGGGFGGSGARESRMSMIFTGTGVATNLSLPPR